MKICTVARVTLLSLVVPGCVTIKDVSQEPEYTALIGTRHTLNQPMSLFKGKNNELGTRYVLVAANGSRQPEAEIPAGTAVTLQAVKRTQFHFVAGSRAVPIVSLPAPDNPQERVLAAVSASPPPWADEPSGSHQSFEYRTPASPFRGKATW